MNLQQSVQVKQPGTTVQVDIATEGRSRVVELMVLQRIGRALNSTLDEIEILHLLIEETVDVTPAEQGSVLLYDPDQACLLPRAWFGYTPEQVDTLVRLGRDVDRGIIHRVFDTGQAAATQDVGQDPDYVQIAPNTRSELTVPIRHGLDVVGVIDLESSQPDAFDEGTQRFVLTIAEQAGIAIGNARRFSEQVAREQVVTQRNEQLRRLLEISQMLGQQHALDDLLDIIVQAIPETVGFNVALLSLVEGNPPQLRRVAAAGIPLADFEQLQQATQPLGVLERTLKDKYRLGQSYFFPHQQRAEWDDGYTHKVIDTAKNWQEGHWHPYDMLLVPLRDSAGALLGLISVDDPQDGLLPTQDTIQALELFAHEAALAIETTRLYENARRRATHLDALWHVNQQLATIRDFNELLKQVVQIIRSYFDYDHINLYLIEASHAALILRAHSGQEGVDIGPVVHIPIDQPGCIISWVAANNRSLLLDATSNAPVSYPSSTMQLLGSRSELAVPLYIGEQVAGVLDVHSHRAEALSREDLFVIESLGAQLSVAFENARLYDELEQRVHSRTAELADALKQQALEVDKTRAIVESISDAVIVFNPKGDVVLVNPGVGRTFGVPHRQWMRCSLDNLKIPNLSKRDNQTMRAVFESVRKARGELANGQDLVTATFEVPDRVIAASFASVVLRDLEPLNVVAVFRDITREVQLDRMKSEFIAMAAHELRTPMTSITGYVNLLATEKAGPVNDIQRRFLRVIHSNSNRLMTLVNDLLDISKIEGEGLKLNLASESMADIVAEIVLSFQQQIEEKGQKLIVNVPTDLPEIRADRDRMIQVVTNLVSNAFKYTPQGGEITVEAWCENGSLVLDVRDTGIGISPQDQERLFSRFFRADNAIETQEGGTGLGLVITREIVERHGGQIEVRSELGMGTVFRVILPLGSAMHSN